MPTQRCKLELLGGNAAGRKKRSQGGTGAVEEEGGGVERGPHDTCKWM